MRREFEMTPEDLGILLEACKPKLAIMLQAGTPSVQQSANAAWEGLGRRMGFDAMSVLPIPSKGDRFFSAEEVTA